MRPGAALAQRVVCRQTKALREAKQHSDWLAPDADYERACEQFVRTILTPRGVMRLERCLATLPVAVLVTACERG